MSSKKVVSKKVVSTKKKVVAPVKTVKKPVAKKAEKIVAPVKKTSTPKVSAPKFTNPKTDMAICWAVVKKQYHRFTTGDGIVAIRSTRKEACEFSKLQKGKTVTKKIKVVASII